jgi:hypothetical protein
MKRAQTRVWRLAEPSWRAQKFRTAISLHSHTCHSKESADFIPLYIQRIPILNRVIPSSLRQFEERTGKKIDFRKVYWTPPVLPATVLASERLQIERQLDLSPLVSITDHDTIAAPLSLRKQPDAASVPISVEWSVPYAGNTFHIGVHNLPPALAVEIMKELARYTAEPAEERLRDVFAVLSDFPETLLVLNHPYFDFARMGAVKHRATLEQFLTLCKPWIHALELGGIRPWRENQEVLRMADEQGLPIVAGGDRHGCHSNGVLNLSRSESWGDFVSGIRDGRQNDILLLPACEEPVAFRELQIASDVSRHYPGYPYGYRQFTDRIFFDMEGYSWHPLSFYWSGGMPFWLRPVFGGIAALGLNPVRPVLRRVLSLVGDSDLATWPTRAGYQSDGVSFHKEAR